MIFGEKKSAHRKNEASGKKGGAIAEQSKAELNEMRDHIQSTAWFLKIRAFLLN